jgi:hypothetical protein
MSGANAAGPVADAAVEDMRRLERVLYRDLMRSVMRLDTKTGEDSLIKRQAQTQAAVLRQINKRLDAEGEDLKRVTGERAVEAVRAVLGAPPSTLSVDVRTELDQILADQIRDVVRTFKVAADEMRVAVTQGIVSSGGLADVVDAVAGKMQVAYARAAAAVDAAIMAAGRHVVMSAATASGLDLVYVYVGPSDAKNRPFCLQWVGKACVDPENLDNKQGLPVETYCGGYNCRHSWAPTIIDEAVSEGIEVHMASGKRVA